MATLMFQDVKSEKLMMFSANIAVLSKVMTYNLEKKVIQTFQRTFLTPCTEQKQAKEVG
jgi:hypothetical protein